MAAQRGTEAFWYAVWSVAPPALPTCASPEGERCRCRARRAVRAAWQGRDFSREGEMLQGLVACHAGGIRRDLANGEDEN